MTTTPTTRLALTLCLVSSTCTFACNTTDHASEPCAPAPAFAGDAGGLAFGDDAATTPTTTDDPPVSPGPKRVFITTREYPGNLIAIGHTENGALGADAICDQAARDAGLDGRWKAWVSTSFENAIDRIQGTGPFVRLDGVVIADTHDQLANSELLAPVAVNEHGVNVCEDGGGTLVWTGTRADGTWDTNNCLDWTTDDRLYQGANGNACDTDARWTTRTDEWHCHEELAFYCFEQ